MKKRELIIVGGGPAGLNAAVYAARYKIDSEILTRAVGGIVFTVHKVCNFLSYAEISGAELTKRMKEHVSSLKVPISLTNVQEISKEKGGFKIKTSDGDFFSKKVIFASGTHYRELGAKGEGIFRGKGVSYCATCDGPFFKDKDVAVIGGGDSAVTSALILSEHAKKVYIIHRRNELRAEPTWIESAKKNKKINMILNDRVKEIFGSNFVEGIKLESGKSISVQGVFVEIGSVPDLSPVSKLNLKTDSRGFIMTNQKMETNIRGLFAAGDIASKDFRQISTAISDGAVAALSAYEQIKKGE